VTIEASPPVVLAAVIQAATTALAGQVAVSGSAVAVVEGEIGTYVADEYVVIHGLSNGSQKWGHIGTQRRDEKYTIHGLIRAYVGNEDQAYCRNRVFQLYDLLGSVLDTDPSVGAVVNESVQAEWTDLRMGVTDAGGRAAELDFQLPVSTQLIAT